MLSGFRAVPIAHVGIDSQDACGQGKEWAVKTTGLGIAGGMASRHQSDVGTSRDESTRALRARDMAAVFCHSLWHLNLLIVHI